MRDMMSLWIASSAALAVANTPNTSDPAEPAAIMRTVMKPSLRANAKCGRTESRGGNMRADSAPPVMLSVVSNRQFPGSDIGEIPANQELPAARSRHGATSSLRQQ